MKNIAIFASGGGSNLKAIYSSIVSQSINGKIAIVVSNNPTSGAIEFAKECKINFFVINKQICPDQYKRESNILEELINKKIDLICLAGYLKLVPEKIINHYKNCILNIHPSLLPQYGGKGFYGMHVHEAVIASGDKRSGVTIHFVNEKYDRGEILIQEVVEVKSNDTPESLSHRILKIEHRLYSFAIKAFCENKIVWEKGVPLLKDIK